MTGGAGCGAVGGGAVLAVVATGQALIYLFIIGVPQGAACACTVTWAQKAVLDAGLAAPLAAQVEPQAAVRTGATVASLIVLA